jgi:hypothetical protein
MSEELKEEGKSVDISGTVHGSVIIVYGDNGDSQLISHIAKIEQELVDLKVQLKTKDELITKLDQQLNKK